ncbi:MAG: D-alanine--D-alanine ligase family protein [Lachnospiraceae bacterium]|nr:D-alanine--D-alanine ligase family protein [Lachnospiraceae bacterium]
MLNKKTVAVIFGGQSSEHEISRISATTIISSIDSSKYYVIPVGITKKGKWMIYSGPVENIKTGEWEKFGTPAVLSPDPNTKGLLKIVGGKVKTIPVDVIFPVLHGAWGEDGTIQGLFELAHMPYVGCGVLSSAVSMDKEFTKIVAKNARINQAKYLVIKKWELSKKQKSIEKKVSSKIGYPCFVKPANAGSSVGISKVKGADTLFDALNTAAKYDNKLIIESAVIGREVECSVIGNGEKIAASCVGEIFAAAEFYDYDAKYNNAASRTVIPADLDEETVKEIKKTAVKVFKAVNGSGLARIDFFVEKDTNKVIFNELNTMPGFTSISMYPMLWRHEGISTTELMDRLICLAVEKETSVRA